MSDETTKAEQVQSSAELAEGELEKAVGGITKLVDSASPKLVEAATKEKSNPTPTT